MNQNPHKKKIYLLQYHNLYILPLLPLFMVKGDNKKKEKTCQHCHYVWETTSKKKYVTCPDCLRKTNGGNKKVVKGSGKK